MPVPKWLNFRPASKKITNYPAEPEPACAAADEPSMKPFDALRELMAELTEFYPGLSFRNVEEISAEHSRNRVDIISFRLCVDHFKIQNMPYDETGPDGKTVRKIRDHIVQNNSVDYIAPNTSEGVEAAKNWIGQTIIDLRLLSIDEIASRLAQQKFAAWEPTTIERNYYREMAL